MGAGRRRRARPAAALIGALLAGLGCLAAGQMVDPSIDGLTGPFSYLAEPSGALGGIGAGRATQVTWDGALYTGEVELCLVAGDPPHPVAVRAKRLGGGYVPLLHYGWMEGDVRVSVSAFASAVGQGGDPANFVRLQMARLGDSGQPASVGFALRHSGGDHRVPRPGQRAFDPASRYAFEQGCAAIDDRVVCVLPTVAPTRQYAVAGEPYSRPFTGSEYGVGPQTAVLLALWDLGDQPELTIDLKMPWTPPATAAHPALQALKQASYDEQAEEVAEAWTEELGRGMQVLLPEGKPLEAYQASVAYLLMCTEIPREGAPRLFDPLRGIELPLGEAALAQQSLDRSGRPDLARNLAAAWLEGQQPDGAFTADGALRPHCEALLALIGHTWLLGDRPWAEGAYARLRRAAEWVVSRLSAGQMQPGSRDWLLATETLGAVGELAALIGQPEDANLYRMHYAEALAAAERALEGTPLADDATAPLLGLNRGLPDSPEPTCLAPQADRVTELCRRLRETTAEGLVTDGGLLSPLRTMDVARLHALRGEQEQAIRDLYAVLVHTGSCHEGFAGGVRPWADRDAGAAASPDPRFAAGYAALLRDLLIREQRGELHLFSAFSPEWLRSGKLIGVQNAPTAFGLVTAVLQIEDDGATLGMVAAWHAPPSRVIVHVPYCANLTAVSADQPGVKQTDGPPPIAYPGSEPPLGAAAPTQAVELRPNTTIVTLKWEPRAGAALSYDAAVQAWQQEYAARYQEYLNAGQTPATVEPIPLR